MKNTDLQQLFDRYLSGRASPEEVKLLLRQFDDGVNRANLRAIIRKELEANHDIPEQLRQNWKPVLQKAYHAIKMQIDSEQQTGKTVRTPPRSYHRWLKYSAAAVIALLVASTVFILLNDNRKEASPKIEIVQQRDLAPGGNKATLTLANGTMITLDSAQKGVISTQGNTKIVKQNRGLLVYNKMNTGSSKTLFNTIGTPKGGQYQVVLSDGTKVWLNAASSIHFPNEFTGENREVSITGEAYLEVAQNEKKPFKVLVDGITVQVLGTHFNVRAYNDESFSKVTLLQGAVKVTEGDKDILLKPGEQVQIEPNGHITKVKNVDLQGIIAWKNNQFWFDNDDIQTVMRELSRWYNVNVVIKGDIRQHFGGYISRKIYVSKVFEALQATGHLQYKIQDSTIIVSP